MAYIVWGQVLYLVFLGVCVALHPGLVLKRDEGGVSNYGIHLKTAVPYSLALVSLAFCSERAARLFSRSDGLARRLRQALLFYSTIIMVILFSTYFYSLNHVLRDIHIGLGSVLITFETVVAVWIFGSFRRRWDAVFLAVELAGAILSLVTIVGVLQLLFVSEILTNTGFACLLIHAGRVAPLEESASASPSRTPQALRRFMSPEP